MPEMDLGHLFDNAHDGAFFKIIGTKVQDKLREVRQTRREENARRWGWELIQNAKDVAHDGCPVRVSFQLEEGEAPRLVARHSGRPFQPDQLFYLIVQTSSKERPTGEAEPTTTGRYGTGFLTTHLLSPAVEVEGILEAPGAPPARFSVELDRSGATLEELTAAVKRALSVRDRFASLPRAEAVDPNEYNTSFAYPLDARGIDVARQGLEDLHRSVPLMLAFTEEVGEVTVQGVTYRREGRGPIAEGVERVHVVSRGPSGEGSHWFVVARGEKSAAAVRLDASEGEVRVLGLGDEVPRLFCDFPLLGSESFPLPFAVNSPWFYPDEARSGVYVEDESDVEVAVNRTALAEVSGLLGRLLAVADAEGWQDRYHLAGFGVPPGMPTQSAAWYRSAVLEPARDALLTAPVVETAEGSVLPLRKPLGGPDKTPTVWLPSHADTAVREGIWRFASADGRRRKALPKEEHVEAWGAIAWGDCAQLTATRLTMMVSEIGSVNELADRLALSREEAVRWLGDLAGFLVEHDLAGLLRTHQGRVQIADAAGRYSWKSQPVSAPMLPNQLGAFCSSADLYLDGELDETLKDIAGDLEYDVRAELLDSAVYLEERFVKGTKTPKALAQTIEEAVKERVKGTRSDATRRAFRSLYLWMKEHEAEARDLFGMWLYEHRALLVPPEDVIELMDRVPKLEAENATLREQTEALRRQQEALRAEVEAAMSDASRYQQLQTWLEAEGVGFDALPALLGELKELVDSDRRGLSAEDQAMVAFVDELQQFADVEMTSVDAFRAFVEARPDLFHHRSEADRYLLFLQKAERARAAVYATLKDKPELYDLTDWTPCPRRPTVVLGVRRRDRTHGRPLLLVVRPSDGGRVIFYHREELAALADPEAELWTEDPRRGVQRLTLGGVLQELRDRMGVNQVPVA
ncbi:sacsin N-terminal ATP-binding-like domain-containing protein [Rubrivirga sp. IMCC43871]|uniref:bZIP transcription factor n=1 Tax=Rubrivirga sp. IMCC43871 TaxID=3391575 RepID=UPI00398FEA25